jgi:exonuclease III
MDMNDRSPQITNQITLNNNSFKVYHQNVINLRKQSHKLLGHLYSVLPHVMCLTEHHVNILEKTYVNIEGYTIRAQFCRVLYEKGGVIIYVHNSLQYTNIDLSKYGKEKDIEICAVKLIINSLNMFTIAIYRAPTGNFKYILQKLDNILQSFSTPSSHIIICGDLNINYLVKNEQKKQFDNLLPMYNLISIVNFPTRINNASASALDNFFIDASRYENFSVIPFWNDLLDHDTQILTINIPVQKQSVRSKLIR